MAEKRSFKSADDRPPQHEHKKKVKKNEQLIIRKYNQKKDDDLTDQIRKYCCFYEESDHDYKNIENVRIKKI